jgi:hypothetical protein
MKTLLRLLFLCCIGLQLSAQNWKTVQSGRKDYFIHKDLNNGKLIGKMIYVDGVGNKGKSDSIYYFFKSPKTYSNSSAGHCYNYSDACWLGKAMVRNEAFNCQPGSYKLLYLKSPNYNFGIKNMLLKSNYLTKPNISFYPNPANNTIYIRGDIQNISNVSIYNLNNQLLHQQNHTNSINIENLPPNIYFIKFITHVGSTNVEKFIKE